MRSDESWEKTSWRVAVDRNRRTGSSMCESVAAGHFAVVDGVSRPLAEVIKPNPEIREAAGFCPDVPRLSNTGPDDEDQTVGARVEGQPVVGQRLDEKGQRASQRSPAHAPQRWH